MLVTNWGNGAAWEHRGDNQVAEAHFLTLDSHRAGYHLGWAPVWRAALATAHSVRWYKDFLAGADMYRTSLAEIAHHEESVTATAS
jgi:hypothetical protein